ncbi:N-acetylmuramoyl-L-alanine amidase [Nonomuraea sp. NPDC048916]|uniref:N-acetylmuramoyl-L-alanine amidase n=1 Tax=Nonomuraea sp. NPDC048916 TaxID=3154232 RepID=UPI0033E02384
MGVAMLLWVIAGLAVSALAGPSQPGRQAEFAEAARAYGVPVSVLLGVSYLESRWDVNAGEPSTGGGYGPMHLVDTDAARPVPDEVAAAGVPARPAPGEATLRQAARLTGLPVARLRTDPAANIRGGAAVLASYQGRRSSDPADWHDAITRYSGSRDFADEVFAVIREGAARRTDDGFPVRLEPKPGLRPDPPPPPARQAECPASLACEWMPAAHRRTGGGYGNHDRLDGERRIDYIVIHDTEGAYDGLPKLVHDPDYVSWHYTVRSRDGHVAQHVRTQDIAWHAGNWDVNTRSIGIEHEGYLAKGGTWYTEAMYRASAKLVSYLAARHDIPIDRAHIFGHDTVPGTTPESLPGMHEDPGPYWDWAHYFDLMGSPIEGARGGTSVIIRPDYETHLPRFTGCSKTGCEPHGASTVWLRTEPRADAPLIDDIGKRVGRPSTHSVYDHSARASTGQRFAVAGTSGDWTAIWYLGQKAWFRNPPDRPTAVPARGPLVTPINGRVRVYGRAYPERSAYRGTRAAYQQEIPLQYVIRPGQYYSLGLTLPGSYLATGSLTPARHVRVEGTQRFHQIQLGHRIAFVMAKDVRVIR